MNSDFQVVTGQCGRGIPGPRFGRIVTPEGQDAEGAADLGSSEGGGFLFREGAEFAGPALDDGAGNFV